MQVGDPVEVHFSKGDIRLGKIASVGRHTVTVRLKDHPDAGVITVPIRRLKAKGKDHWHLDL